MAISSAPSHPSCAATLISTARQLLLQFCFANALQLDCKARPSSIITFELPLLPLNAWLDSIGGGLAPDDMSGCDHIASAGFLVGHGVWGTFLGCSFPRPCSFWQRMDVIQDKPHTKFSLELDPRPARLATSLAPYHVTEHTHFQQQRQRRGRLPPLRSVPEAHHMASAGRLMARLRGHSAVSPAATAAATAARRACVRGLLPSFARYQTSHTTSRTRLRKSTGDPPSKLHRNAVAPL